MKSKIFGFITCIFLIGFSIIPVTGNIMDIKEIKKQTTSKSEIINYWTEQEKLFSSDGASGDYFGNSVSIDGNYAVVGAYDENNGTGAAYIFFRIGTNWIEQQKLTASDGEIGDNFGCSVSIFENLTIVGAKNDEGGIGSAYLFNRSGTKWIEERKLIASDGETGDYFGSSVSINKKLAIVGAVGDDSYKGSVYAYNYSITNVTETIKLEAPDGEIGDHFGCSLFFNGRFAIIGAYEDDGDKGSAYILEHCCYWKWREKINTTGGLPYFGWSVSIDGDHAIIGAPGKPDSGSTGSVYIFKREENNWFEHTHWIGSNNEEYLGMSVSIDGGYAVAGALGNDSNIGMVKTFIRNGTIWSEEQILTASDGESGDYFGNSVSINAGYIITGAIGDDENTGSAYIFMKIGVPDLSIEIIGGFGANIIITNNGENDTKEFDVKVHITGGIFKRVNKSYNFTINLLAGESKRVSTGIFFGLGEVYITATTDYKEKTVYALQLLVYTFIQ